MARVGRHFDRFGTSGLPRLISGLLDTPDLIESVMSIIERVPIVIRAKLYLLLAYACEKDDTGMLLLRATQLRLFTMVSRDDRFDDDPPEKRGPDGSAEHHEPAESDTVRHFDFFFFFFGGGGASYVTLGPNATHHAPCAVLYVSTVLMLIGCVLDAD